MTKYSRYGVVISVSLTRYSRNEYGEYFMFMFDIYQKKPFFKHTPQRIAKAILKDKYIE
ncbi:MAG: hypothetical protein RLZZ210_1170, partial [Pseudomonadota bacterium]